MSTSGERKRLSRECKRETQQAQNISNNRRRISRFRGGMLEARGIAPSENRNLALGDIDRAQGRREVVADHFLVECATGYALFLANGISDIGDPTKYTVKYEAAKEYINRPVTPFVLKDYVAFTSHEDALIEMNSILKSNVTDKLVEFLKKNFEPPFNHHELVTADFRLGLLILKKLGLGNYSSFLTNLVMRALRERIDEFIKLPHGDLDKAQRHLTCLYKDHMRTKLDIKSPVSSFLQEHVTIVPQFEGFFNVKGETNLLCTKNLVPGEALYGEELIRVQNEVGTEVEYRVCDPCRSKLGAALLRGVTNTWIKPGSRVIYVGNVCGLTVSDLSDLVGQDGFVYAVGLSDDVAHMAGNRPNVVTFTEKILFTRYRMLLSMVDVVFGEIDHLHKYSAEASFISSHAKFYLKAGGHYMICTKGNNTNSMGHAIFSHLYTASEFKPIQTVMLDLVEGAYALDIGGCRMPDE